MATSPRRWFQFKLSTWFVLVGIVAWAMMLRPWGVRIVDPVGRPVTRADYTAEEWQLLSRSGSYRGGDLQKPITYFADLTPTSSIPRSR